MLDLETFDFDVRGTFDMDIFPLFVIRILNDTYCTIFIKTRYVSKDAITYKLETKWLLEYMTFHSYPVVDLNQTNDMLII